jgi:hypothetical protein
MYKNGKMRPVETILRRRRGAIKESTFVNVMMYHPCKNNMIIDK